MLFNKDNKIANEKIIYKTKPNFFFSCKKAFFAFIILALILGSTSPIISYIGELQVYMIERIKLPLTTYSIIAIVVIVLILLFYIFWQIISWYSTEYILTDQRIITKKGVFLTKKNYMPYKSIQDVSSSQSILGRIFSIGSVSFYSAYDNSQIYLEDVSKADYIEEVIFNHYSENRPFNNNHNQFNKNYSPYPKENAYEEEYPPYENGEHYPNDNYDRNEYYPKDNFQEEFLNDNFTQKEDYHDENHSADNYHSNEFENTINEAMHNLDNDIKFKPNELNNPKQNFHSENDYNPDSYQNHDNSDNKHIKENYHNENYNNENIINKQDNYENDSDENILKKHSRKFRK